MSDKKVPTSEHVLSIELIVEKAYPTDEFGKGVIPLSTDHMSLLGIVAGDPVEIEGERKTLARVWKANILDSGEPETVRIDTFIRNNAKVSLGDVITIRKASVVPAQRLTLAPLDGENIVMNSEIEDLIRYNLMGRYVLKEDIIPIRRDLLPLSDDLSESEMKKQTIEFFVTQATPSKSNLIVTENTKISFARETGGGRKKYISYEDIGGLGDQIREIRDAIEIPLKQPRLFKKLKIQPPKGLILYGIPGTGKTMVARAVADEIGANFYYVAGPEIIKSGIGQTEEYIRELFSEASKNSPSIIFIDEIDSVAPKREDSGDVERRVVSQLLTMMDGMLDTAQVFIVGATNRLNSIEPALRRPGRFDREIEIGAPDTAGREEILRIHARSLPLEGYSQLKALEKAILAASWEDRISDLSDLKEKKQEEQTFYDKNAHDLFYSLAVRTQGFVGADLAGLCREAALNAIRRITPLIDLNAPIPDSVLEQLIVMNEDFEYALKISEPSALREISIEIPTVTWGDVGGLETAKQEIIETVEWPLKYPEKFKKLGVSPPAGILLYGPPGTGKTLLAQAIASESHASFISVKSTELLTKWVGDSEKAIKEIFRKAKHASPSIIFFDEIDAFATVRDSSSTGTKAVAESTLNQMLVEMDGIDRVKDIFIVAATNRPDTLDPALLRPGRLDRMVYIGAPELNGRISIFDIYLKKIPLADDVSSKELAKLTQGYTGADIESVCREAVMISLRDDFNVEKISFSAFLKALEKVPPSVSESIDQHYKSISFGPFIKKHDDDSEIAYR